MHGTDQCENAESRFEQIMKREMEIEDASKQRAGAPRGRFEEHAPVESGYAWREMQQ